VMSGSNKLPSLFGFTVPSLFSLTTKTSPPIFFVPDKLLALADEVIE
jgi:hypothetical protein